MKKRRKIPVFLLTAFSVPVLCLVCAFALLFAFIPGALSFSVAGADAIYAGSGERQMAMVEERSSQAMEEMAQKLQWHSFVSDMSAAFSTGNWNGTGSVISRRYEKGGETDRQTSGGTFRYLNCAGRLMALIDGCIVCSSNEGGAADGEARHRAEEMARDTSPQSYTAQVLRENPDADMSLVTWIVKRGKAADTDNTYICRTILAAASHEAERNLSPERGAEEMILHVIQRADEITGLSDGEPAQGFWSSQVLMGYVRTEETEEIYEWVDIPNGIDENGHFTYVPQYIVTGRNVIPHLELTYTYYLTPSADRERTVMERCGISGDEILLELPNGETVSSGMSERDAVILQRNGLLTLFGFGFYSSTGPAHLPRDMTVCRISCPYGAVDSYHPGGHDGIDIASGGREGMAVWAVGSGTVVKRNPVPFSPEYRSDVPDYGNYVVIDHGNGVQTVYGHLAYADPALTVGTHVEAGQQIGIMGSTGYSTGIHLHFETRVNGVAADPCTVEIDGVNVGMAILRRDLSGRIGS